jgi:hypothetical protein
MYDRKRREFITLLCGLPGSIKFMSAYQCDIDLSRSWHTLGLWRTSNDHAALAPRGYDPAHWRVLGDGLG